MAITVYTDEALTQRLKKRVGSLTGYEGNTQTSFTVEEEPSEVRWYSPSTPWGNLYTNWTYDDGTKTVYLGDTPGAGDIVVAWGSGVWLFSQDFLAENVVTEVERDIYVYVDQDYDCIYVGLDLIIDADVDTTWYRIGKEIAPDEWDWYAYHTICNLTAGSTTHMKVKLELIDPDAEYHNYYNVSIYTGHLHMPTD